MYTIQIHILTQVLPKADQNHLKLDEKYIKVPNRCPNIISEDICQNFIFDHFPHKSRPPWVHFGVLRAVLKKFKFSQKYAIT